MHSIIASIVNDLDIVVCISANDGTRTYTNVAIGLSGGSAPTDVIPAGQTATNLNDVAFSTTPSKDYDSGAIDVGGTTLDDIFAAPPQDPQNAPLASQHAFAETRWTGFTAFSSGFGSRVNVSAPADNVLAFEHPFGGQANAVAVSIEGGTSASAPETAAAAAVALQVARLTGRPLASAIAVRKILQSAGTQIPNVPQADAALHIGPQTNLRRLVEMLLRQAGDVVRPAVARVAVEQRRNVSVIDNAFTTWTDPTDVDLQGPLIVKDDGSFYESDADEDAWITIAPDWEGMPANTTYRLSVDTSGTSSAARVSNVQSLRHTAHLQSDGVNVLATTPWARLLPAKILQAAGLPLASTSSRTVQLTYQAQTGTHVLTSVAFSLTFGPADATTTAALAPSVPPVITGSTIPVSYDLTNVRFVSNPTLVVSEPGRTNPLTGAYFYPAYSQPLSAAKGTVNVPVTALHGNGIYGIAINLGGGNNVPYPTFIGGRYSDFAFTRIATTQIARAAAPMLATAGSAPGHFLEIAYGSVFTVSWDASNVPGATGAYLEISDGGPAGFFNYNPFNNPNGTGKDENGIDHGSVYYAPLPGVRGSETLNGLAIGLQPALNHVVRIIPTRGGAPVGEGSDVSSITMDGVVPSNGGYVKNGFAINQNGTDAFMTSDYFTPSNQLEGDVETFDPNTKSVLHVAETESAGEFFTDGLRIAAGDIGFVDDFAFQNTTSDTYNLLDPVMSGAVGSAWTAPSGVGIIRGETNPLNGTAVFEAYNTSNPSQETLFTSNLAANTTTTGVPITSALAPYGVACPALGVNYNTSTALLACTARRTGYPGQPVIVEMNPISGTSQSFAGPFGSPVCLAIDSTTNQAIIVTRYVQNQALAQHLAIYNLADGSSIEAQRSGTWGVYAAADEVHGLFLVADIYGGQPQGIVYDTNNNFKSTLAIYDEHGNLLKSDEQLVLFNTSLNTGVDNLQVDPIHRTAYVVGPFQQQIVPIIY